MNCTTGEAEKQAMAKAEGNNPDTSEGPKPGASMVTTLASRRIPRENGFRDFCLGRILLEDRRSKVLFYHSNSCNEIYDSVDITEWMDEELLLGNSNLLFKELGSFQKGGPFPFFKLPLDIHRKIYQMLLQPCVDFHPDLNLLLTTIDVSNKPDTDPNCFEGDSKMHLARLGEEEVESLEGKEPYVMLPEEAANEERRYDKEKRALLHEGKLHPSRNHQYEVSMLIYKLVKPRPP
jgi:hypothetical protein